MSALTKAFVVLVTVLSILLTAVVVSTVARYEEQQDVIATLQAEKAATDRRLSTAEAGFQQQTARGEQALAGLNAQIASLRAERDSLISERADLDSKLRDEQARFSGMEVALARLSSADEQKVTLLDTLNAELKERREQSVADQRKLIEATDRVAELQGQLSGLDRQVRRFRERAVAAEERTARMEQAIAALPTEQRTALLAEIGQSDRDTPAVAVDVAIEGRITAVERIADGEVLVELNVGEADGVARAMEFVVSRDGQYLGTLVVDSTDVSASVGRMTLIRGQVQANDRVLAGQY